MIWVGYEIVVGLVGCEGTGRKSGDTKTFSGRACVIRSLFQGHSPGGATVSLSNAYRRKINMITRHMQLQRLITVRTEK